MELSFNMDEFIADFEKSCIRVQKKSFEKNETITTYIQKRNQFCILKSGTTDLVRYDLNGNRTIVESFTKMIFLGKFFILLLKIMSYQLKLARNVKF